MKTIALLIFSVLITSGSTTAYAVEKQSVPTDVGTFEVSMKTNPLFPELGEKTYISFEVLTTPTRQPQIHVDYEVLILRDEQTVLTTGVSHTHTGLATTDYTFDLPGEYVVGVFIDGINFRPIPTETASFKLVVGDIKGSSDTKTEEAEIMTESKTKTQIPNWIKQVAEFWVADQIDDAGFVQVIEYLVQQGIITIPYAEAPEGDTTVKIPSWIKTNAEFWVNGNISDDEFAIGLEWLINNGIIRV